MIHERITNINNNIFIAEATLTRFSRSRKSITDAMKIPVNKMDKCGVLNCLFTFAKKSGRSWSRLIANGNRDADNIRQAQSPLYDIELTNRYVSSMQSKRGLVGSTIPLTGRGFTEFDTVVIGDIEAETQFISSNVLTFKVPSLPAGKIYDVELNSGYGPVSVGEFRIDPATIRANKSRIDLKTEERTTLVFHIGNEAPKTGLPLKITTDTPELIIMPEAEIPAGAKTISVVIEGGFPGEGNLFIEAPGYEEVAIPVNITESDSWES